MKRIHVLGEGNFGKVWKVQDDKGKEYALKIISKKKMKKQRIKHEFNVLKELASLDFVPKVYSMRETENDYEILMEYVKGYELQDVPNMSVYDFCTIMRHLLKSLVALHEKNIVHRDIKPDNIRFDRERMVILDYGLSCVIGDDNKELLKCNRRGGAIAYMAPEIKEKRKLTPEEWKKADVFSFGKTMKVLFDLKLRYLVIPQELTNIISDAMTKDVDHRPTAKQLLLRMKNIECKKHHKINVPEEEITYEEDQGYQDDGYDFF